MTGRGKASVRLFVCAAFVLCATAATVALAVPVVVSEGIVVAV
jgi:hypothetical protein